jgi:MinD superfamily P-loop ATPase
MKISIASGKGGTGKTIIATSLAISLGDCQFLDCDVEEPNAHIFLKPEFHTTKKILVNVPLIDSSICTNCGICSDACEFNALVQLPDHVIFFADLCMSCNACQVLCPENAISMVKREIGVLNIGDAKENTLFVNGLLKIGSPRAIPIISAVKDCGDDSKIVILDAPPGNSCPVIETISDTDFCLLVTEPTPFGLWDLKIAVEVAKKLALPIGVIINRYGLGYEKPIEDYCEVESIPILMKVPFDRSIAEEYSKGIPLVNLDKDWQRKFRDLFSKIQELV